MERLIMQANAGPWVRLAQETGSTVKWWRVSAEPPFATSMDDLKGLLTDKTRIVAVPHVSNMLGEVLDLDTAVQLVRSGPAGDGSNIHHPFMPCVPDVYVPYGGLCLFVCDDTGNDHRTGCFCARLSFAPSACGSAGIDAYIHCICVLT